MASPATSSTTDVIYQVIPYLGKRDTEACATVCKEWNEAASGVAPQIVNINLLRVARALLNRRTEWNRSDIRDGQHETSITLDFAGSDNRTVQDTAVKRILRQFESRTGLDILSRNFNRIVIFSPERSIAFNAILAGRAFGLLEKPKNESEDQKENGQTTPTAAASAPASLPQLSDEPIDY